MPPPPPRFDGTIAKADDGDKRAMPPPPPLFSARKMEGAEKHEGDLAPAARAEPPADAPRAPAGGYEVPEWGGPSSADFSLEVLKDGAIVDVVDCRGRGCVTLGRTPDNDVVLEHPSSSRTHAAIQFARGGSEAFVFDNASTHGTFVNKRRLKARVHAPVFVGDQIRFGQSSRVFVVSGASELMPEEGLSRDERRRLRALEKMSEAERTRSSGSSGAHGLDASSRDARGGGDWGMDDEDDRPSESALKLAALDWRDHAGALSEKQEKQKEKIRRKEEKVRALRTESERISAKESESTPLTQGQRVTLARNESALEKLEEEIEDADEALNESIRASLGGAAAKRAARERGATSPGPTRKTRAARTRTTTSTTAPPPRPRGGKERRKQAREGNRRGRGLNNPRTPVAVETAATLWEKKSVAAAVEASKATLAERRRGRRRVRTSFLLERRRWRRGRPGTVALRTETKLERWRAPDDLDAFMVSVARARRGGDGGRDARVAEKEAELARLDRLLRLADPRGGSRPDRTCSGASAPGGGARARRRGRAERAAQDRGQGAGSAARAAAEARSARLAEWEKRGELTASARLRERSERSERWRRRRRRRAGIGRPGERGGECGAPRRRVHRAGGKPFEKAAAEVGGSANRSVPTSRGIDGGSSASPAPKDDDGVPRAERSARRISAVPAVPRG